MVSLFSAPPANVPADAEVLHGVLVREGDAVDAYRAQHPTIYGLNQFIGFLQPADADAAVAIYAGASSCNHDTQFPGGPDIDVYLFGTYVGGEDGTPSRFEAFSEWLNRNELSGIDLSRFAEYETP